MWKTPFEPYNSATRQAVGKRNVRWRKDEPYVPIATLNADINDQVILYDLETYERLSNGEKVTLTDDSVFAWQIVKDAVSGQSGQSTKSASAPAHKRLTVLLAGHDFKFLPEITTKIRQAGHRILIDRWDGHSGHDEELSRRMLSEADVIFCEWALGNVDWYSYNKLPGQRLITRFHAQELRPSFYIKQT